MKLYKFLSLAAVCAASTILYGGNLAAGKRFVYEQRPTYHLTTDANDPLDLTDGKFKNDDIWFYKESVGWYGGAYYSFHIDLGERVSIDKVRIHMAQGHGSVHYPVRLLMLAGHRPDKMTVVCDMIAVNRDIIPPYENGRHRMWLESKNHRAFKARYVKFIVFPEQDSTYFFTDEIEILSGPANAPTLFTDRAFQGNTAGFINFMRLEERLNLDAAQIRQNAALAHSNFNVARLVDQISRNHQNLALLKDNTDFPINQAQIELAKANQQIMHQAGLSGIVMWSAVRWDVFTSFQYPQDDPSCYDLAMSAGESRNMALNFTNADPGKKVVRFKVDSPFPVTVMRGFSMADARNFFNSNRLEELTIQNGYYSFELLPGESVQIFLKAAVPATAAPGSYTVIATLDNGTKKEYKITLGHLKFPAELSTLYGTWDYLNSLRCHGQVVDQSNLARAMQLIRDYQMNLSWGHEAALPKVTPDMFGDDDSLIKPLDFTKLDQWLHSMPGFRRYALFGGGNLKSRLNTGFEPLQNRERFMARLTNYLNAIAAHIENDLNMDVSKFMLHFIDEASTPEQKAILATWTLAITRAASPSGKHFISYGNPFPARHELYAYPEIDMYQPSNSACSRDVIMQLMSINSVRRSNGEFGLYSCANRFTERDAYIYCGGTFRLGFLFENYVGSSFWNLATAPRDVCDFSYSGRYFSPWYFRGNDIFVSRQYEAIWEGREDYEYLNLLKIITGKLIADNHPLAFEAGKLAADIRQDLIHELSTATNDTSLWITPKKRDVADIHRRKIWLLMEKVFESDPEYFSQTNWK